MIDKVCRNCGHDAKNFKKHRITGMLRCDYCGLLIRADELDELPTVYEFQRRQL